MYRMVWPVVILAALRGEVKATSGIKKMRLPAQDRVRVASARVCDRSYGAGLRTGTGLYVSLFRG